MKYLGCCLASALALGCGDGLDTDSARDAHARLLQALGLSQGGNGTGRDPAGPNGLGATGSTPDGLGGTGSVPNGVGTTGSVPNGLGDTASAGSGRSSLPDGVGRPGDGGDGNGEGFVGSGDICADFCGKATECGLLDDPSECIADCSAEIGSISGGIVDALNGCINRSCRGFIQCLEANLGGDDDAVSEGSATPESAGAPPRETSVDRE